MIKKYLSEKDLLKKHQKDEYMSNDQLEFFMSKLKHEKELLVDTIEKSKEDALIIDEPTSDENLMASEAEVRTRNLKLIERQTKLLHKVEAAIDRIKSGEYGYCEKTGEPIGIPRLIARPTATLSIEAKEIQEIVEKRTNAD